MLIKIDIDTKIGIVRQLKRIKDLCNVMNIRIVKRRVYKTKKGYHIVITTDEQERKSQLKVVTIQAILGSDPFREAHNMLRVLRHEKDWNILFESKYIIKNSKLYFVHKEKRVPELERYI